MFRRRVTGGKTLGGSGAKFKLSSHCESQPGRPRPEARGHICSFPSLDVLLIVKVFVKLSLPPQKKKTHVFWILDKLKFLDVCSHL